MGTGLGLFVNNTIKLAKIPRPMGTIQSAASVMRNLEVKR
jgi:hypothetical protein